MECVLGDPAAVLPPVAQKRPVLPENCFPGAGEGIRTPDPLITNQMLYQLSYASKIGLPALHGRKRSSHSLPDVRDNFLSYHNGIPRARNRANSPIPVKRQKVAGRLRDVGYLAVPDLAHYLHAYPPGKRRAIMRRAIIRTGRVAWRDQAAKLYSENRNSSLRKQSREAKVSVVCPWFSATASQDYGCYDVPSYGSFGVERQHFFGSNLALN